MSASLGLRVFVSFPYSGFSYLLAMPLAAGVSQTVVGVNVAALYSAVLSMIAISLGFLAGFYLMLIGGQHSFLNKISKTNTYQALRILLEWTLVAMLGCAFVTVALAALEPSGLPFTWQLMGRVVWSNLVAQSFVNGIRCFRIFARFSI